MRFGQHVRETFRRDTNLLHNYIAGADATSTTTRTAPLRSDSSMALPKRRMKTDEIDAVVY
eukprot:COSAG01_NODE_44306_length_420_cov_1.286604_1_plen_60_part_10